jgi:hypothetical protein
VAAAQTASAVGDVLAVGDVTTNGAANEDLRRAVVVYTNITQVCSCQVMSETKAIPCSPCPHTHNQDIA